MTAATAAAPKKSALVLSVGHSLLPFAHRLVREGLEVEVAVVHSPPRYQQAWAGKFKPFLEVRKGGLDEETRKALLEVATSSEAFVVTNSRALSDSFKEHVSTFGQLEGPPGQPTMLAVGAWFDGAGFSGKHLWVRDLGLWPGGAGPAELAGGTLVRLGGTLGWVDQALTPLVTGFQEAKFKGLVAVDVLLEPASHTVRPTGRWQAGWPFLHTHAFVAEQPSLAGVLGGYEASFPKAFTQVVTVSMPPWPLKCNIQPQSVEILGPGGRALQPAELGATFWHDMQVDGRRLQVAGLDGLVAVCRGSADSLDLARQRALRVAQALELPERQLRGDVGEAARQASVVLEELGLLA